MTSVEVVDKMYACAFCAVMMMFLSQDGCTHRSYIALNDTGERDFLSIVGVIDCDIDASSLYTGSLRTNERRRHFQCIGGVLWT